MAINRELVAEKIFNVLKGFGYEVQSFDSDGKLVIDPQEATRFAVAKPNVLVRMDNATDTVTLATGEELDNDRLRKMLKELTHDYLLNFDYKKFNRKVHPKSEKIDIAQSQEKDMADVMEGFGPMTGSTKTSYQPLDNVKIVVKHKKAVNEEIRGARSRNIHSIYIQRGEEKFRMTENNLSAARAMARHISNGGEIYDTVGESITEMASDLRKLREFVRYVQASNLVNESNQEYVTLAFENINEIKDTFKKLSGVKSYAVAVEGVLDRSSTEMLEDDIDLESKFIQTHFDDRVANAMDSIKRSIAVQHKFQREIAEAITKEKFAGLKNLLSESDVIDFTTPQARLSFQVGQLSSSASNPMLKNHLNSISNKISQGGSLNQFEYSTIKSCLLSASEAKVKQSVAESAEERYEQFLEQFDIL